MAAELGIGTRVMLTWAPDEQNVGTGVGAAWATGTIVDGRFEAGTVCEVPGETFVAEHPYWEVDMDGAGSCLVGEHALIPLDDGESTCNENYVEVEVNC